MGTKLKKLFAVLVVATIAFVGLSAFTAPLAATGLACDTSNSTICTIVLPDGTQGVSTGKLVTTQDPAE
ncbi:MAG: hypothetical protein B6D37_09270 [Sphingobacteriales bacterium UTBCD1]|jgi:hypothetical protein|nr:MAG: hypothetical protein B6D37_09270 [Sphingobacteriales bacterium UTBCD1]